MIKMYNSQTTHKSKKAISPVIATVLLIGMVVVLGLIIFLWFRGITKEAVTKFGGTNVELICEEVQLQASYSAGALSLSNIGNVPVFGINLRISGEGAHQTLDITDISASWPNTGLRQGGTFTSEDLSSTFSGADEVLVIPVLLGSSRSGEQSHVCDERFGHEIIL